MWVEIPTSIWKCNIRASGCSSELERKVEGLATSQLWLEQGNLKRRWRGRRIDGIGRKGRWKNRMDPWRVYLGGGRGTEAEWWWRVSRRALEIACVSKRQWQMFVDLVIRVKCPQEAAESRDLILPVRYLDFTWSDSLLHLSYSSVFCLPFCYVPIPVIFYIKVLFSSSFLNWEGLFFLSYNEK